MTANETKKSLLIYSFEKYEYELIVFFYLFLKFIFKNLLGFKKYFTEEPIFDFSDTISIVIGIILIVSCCLYISVKFGQLIRWNGKEFERPFLLIVSLFFACPSTLPFLFSTNSLSGTQMLYPFTLFIFSAFLISKPFFKWIIPLICVLYFIPSVHTSETFFSELRKESLLYVPLILLLLYLNMNKAVIALPKNKTYYKKRKQLPEKSRLFSPDNLLFEISILVSVLSYLYTLIRGKSYSESFFNIEQKLNGYFIVCLIISAPLLIALIAVMYNCVKNKFSFPSFNIFLFAICLLFLLCRNNYYGLWVPFLILSISFIVFYAVWLKNDSILIAIQNIGEFIWKYIYLFFIVMIVMASFSNTTSSFLSEKALDVLYKIPY